MVLDERILREIERHKARIDAEHREKLRALEMLYGVSLSDIAIERSKARQRPVDAPRRGGVYKLVESVIDRVPPEFGVADIAAAIRNERPELDVPRSSLTTALKRLESLGLIRTKEQGIGRKPTTYMRL